MTREERLAVAQTILEQLGGRRFLAMTGAKNVAALDSGVQFALPARLAADGIRWVQVVLTPLDVYTVTFSRTKGRYASEVVSEHTDIYCDQLRGLFERATGLATSLTERYA